MLHRRGFLRRVLALGAGLCGLTVAVRSAPPSSVSLRPVSVHPDLWTCWSTWHEVGAEGVAFRKYRIFLRAHKPVSLEDLRWAVNQIAPLTPGWVRVCVRWDEDLYARPSWKVEITDREVLT